MRRLQRLARFTTAMCRASTNVCVTTVASVFVTAFFAPHVPDCRETMSRTSPSGRTEEPLPIGVQFSFFHGLSWVTVPRLSGSGRDDRW